MNQPMNVLSLMSSSVPWKYPFDRSRNAAPVSGSAPIWTNWMRNIRGYHTFDPRQGDAVQYASHAGDSAINSFYLHISMFLGHFLCYEQNPTHRQYSETPHRPSPMMRHTCAISYRLGEWHSSFLILLCGNFSKTKLMTKYFDETDQVDRDVAAEPY
jgi:hypothetical protein